MSGIGLGLSLQQVVALVANFIIAPALALGSGRLLRLDEPFTLGLVLLGLVAGVSENQ
jgi:BASS family bile acid:Na+ symporter